MLKKLGMLLFITLVHSGAQTIAQSWTAPSPEELREKVDEYMKPYVNMKDFSGTILIAQGDRILSRKAYGMANVELGVPISLETRFPIASITKTFTAGAISILVDRGALRLDDPISRYLPGYPHGNEITVHHLLLHRSGIPDWTGFADVAEVMKKKLTLSETVNWIKDKPLDFPPGTGSRYTNSGYVLLAYLIEKVSGTSYLDFLRTNIFEPLRLNNTDHTDRATLIPQRAAGYQPAAGEAGVRNADWYETSIMVGSGSLYSTVEDLFLWARALSKDKPFKASKLAYPYGWGVRKKFGRTVIEQNGVIAGFYGYLLRYLEDDVTIVFLSNVNSGASDAIQRDLAAILFGEPYEIPKVREYTALSSKQIEALIGRYRFPPDFHFDVVEQNGVLYFRWMSVSELQVLLPESETSLFYRDRYARLTFVKNEAGNIDHVIYDSGEAIKCAKLP